MDVFKNAHNIHMTKEGGGKLKKYKNKLHKGSSASLRAKFMGRFCNFVCVLQVSVQAVCSFQGKKTNHLHRSFVCYEGSMLSLLIFTVMTYQETGVQDDRLGSSSSKFVLSNQRGRKIDVLVQQGQVL